MEFRELEAQGQIQGLSHRILGGLAGIALLVSSGTAMASPVGSIAGLRLAQNTSGDIIIPVETGGSSTGSGSSTTPSGSGTPTGTSTLGNTRFSCQINNGQHTVMYTPESQSGQAYPWAIPSVMGGGWSADRRCNEISRRLESYRPDGLLEMQTGRENGYNTVCVTTQRVPSCRIVLTVPVGQDPIVTRDRIFQNLTIADNGQQTQGVNTFVGGRNNGNLIDQLGRTLGSLGSQRQTSRNLNLRPFLDRADGGTGERLTGGINRSTPRRLSPSLSR